MQGDAGSRTLRLYRYSESSVAVDDPPPASGTLAMLAPYPNPARGGNATSASVSIERGIFACGSTTARGDWCASCSTKIAPPVSTRVRWNGRTTFGQPAASGAYFATIESGVERASTRFLLLRIVTVATVPEPDLWVERYGRMLRSSSARCMRSDEVRSYNVPSRESPDQPASAGLRPILQAALLQRFLSTSIPLSLSRSATRSRLPRPCLLQRSSTCAMPFRFPPSPWRR